MAIYNHIIIIQVKRFRKELHVPTILPTPGTFQGAQFDFSELSMKLAKEEVHIDTYSYNDAYLAT